MPDGEHHQPVHHSDHHAPHCCVVEIVARHQLRDHPTRRHHPRHVLRARRRSHTTPSSTSAASQHLLVHGQHLLLQGTRHACQPTQLIRTLLQHGGGWCWCWRWRAWHCTGAWVRPRKRAVGPRGKEAERGAGEEGARTAEEWLQQLGAHVLDMLRQLLEQALTFRRRGSRPWRQREGGGSGGGGGGLRRRRGGGATARLVRQRW
jgi:hypothetical protein